MNTFKSIAVFSTLMFCVVLPAHAKDWVVALSPYETKEVLAQQTNDVLVFLTELEPGDRAVVMDGYHLQTLGTFVVPTDPKYSHPKAQIALNRKVVVGMLKFSGNAKSSGTAGHPSVQGAIKLPQLLRFVGENIAHFEPLGVLVLGSIRFDDPNQPDFSMLGKFPSDGHLGASRGKTPYGASDSPGLLNDVRVHIAYNDQITEDRLKYYIHRWWTLYVEALGGELVSYSQDMANALNHFKNEGRAIAHDFVADTNAKLEMVTLTPPNYGQSIFDRQIELTPMSNGDITRVETLEIGISWTCERCDIDLFAAPNPNDEILYYANTESRSGRYWKDYRSSPQTLNGYETISFHEPLDLNAAVSAINFYSGQSVGGVHGEIRVSVNNKTYSKLFHIEAENAQPISPDTLRLMFIQGQVNPKRSQTILFDLKNIATSASNSRE